MPIVVSAVGSPPALPVTVTSSDGVLTATADPVNGGVLLKADYSALDPTPYQVRFYRGDLLVRSGAPAWAPGGVAIAYDTAAPLAVANMWTAVPLYLQAGVTTTGPASAGVALTTTDLDEHTDIWVKSVANPALSMRLRSTGDDPQLSTTGRNSLTDVPGSPFQGGTWDVGVVAPRTLAFLTLSKAERDDLAALLQAGPVQVQLLSMYGIDDFYALAGDVNEAYQVGAYDPRRVITVVFNSIPRPPVTGAPLFIPGANFADLNTNYANFDALNAAKGNFLAVVAP